jgi:hypothetical protein
MPAAMADPPERLDYLPYDEREALRYLCRALLDAVSAVKGAQGTLDESAMLLRKAVESHAEAAAAVQRAAELMQRLVAVTTWLDARHELLRVVRPDSGGDGVG